MDKVLTSLALQAGWKTYTILIFLVVGAFIHLIGGILA